MLEKPDHEDADQDRPEQRRNGFERAEHVHHRFAAEDQVTERQQREVNKVRAQYLTECHFGLAQFQGRNDGDQFGQRSRCSYEGEPDNRARDSRSEEHTSELQSLMRNSYAVFCLKKKKYKHLYHLQNKYHYKTSNSKTIH